MKQHFTVPLPPSVNALHRAGNRRVYNSVEYTRWSLIAVRSITDQNPQMVEGRIRLEMHIFVPSESSDLDNRIKACQDLLIGRVCTDDRKVWEIHAHKHIDRRNQRVEIDVESAQSGEERTKLREEGDSKVHALSKGYASRGGKRGRR